MRNDNNTANIDELIRRMKLTEKTSQLQHANKGIARLGISKYNWWNECLHGVARAGIATVFPQSICMAATFGKDLLHKVGDIVSTEARAKYNVAQKNGDFGIYKGLTFWSPNINIYRDPRWGRGQETYGECPTLTASLAVRFIQGLQGDDPHYLKVSACAKHFAVHSGPESIRHSMNAVCSPKDLYETYLPAFEACVKEAHVESVMAAYNMVNGESCAASPTLLQKILRDDWGFDGHVVSDCGGLFDILLHHHATYNPLKAVALAINNGLDLECGKFFAILPLAVKLGYVQEKTVDTALKRTLLTKQKLGLLGNPTPYDQIDESVISCKEHTDFAVQVAEKGIVLLKNDGVLPLDIRKIGKIGLFGANAENKLAYLGNYYGTPDCFVTLADAMQALFGDKLCYAPAIPLCGKLKKNMQHSVAQAIEMAKNCDTIVLCTGIDSSMEGEAGDAGAGKEGIVGEQSDRTSLSLPEIQLSFLSQLSALGKKLIVCNFSGGAIDLSPCLQSANAVLQCWYPGAKGGVAITNILSGKTNPSGKLPVTFYASVDDLPDFEDYSMHNRTYRYFTGKPLFPFGYGLSYTTFTYIDMQVSGDIENGTAVRVSVKNCGPYDGEEIVQLYLSYPDHLQNQPICKLVAFERIFVGRGETQTVTFHLNKTDFAHIDENGRKQIAKGSYTLSCGGGQPRYSNCLQQHIVWNG